MANFNSFKITDSGLDLQYKAQIGKSIKFSKFVLGDGYYTGSIRELKNLVSPVREEAITRLAVSGTGSTKKLVIGFDLESKNVTTGFYLREIGIYALDPDTNQDILMFYTNAGETADYIASNSSDNVSAKLINGELYLSDIEEITAVVDSSLVYATQTDIQNISTQLENKVNKESGKGLSTNDFTNEYKQKLDNLAEEIVVEEEDPTVPQHVKDIQQQDITNWNNKAEKSDIPTVPTKTSDLINDSKFAPISYSTEELEPGVSTLATGAIHVTYE